ncbi:uncharacterized protein EV422DRAFT_420040 [Fimicolochytrium jonesii]|uniref:uncharacterized protein n=1 Tax=Fimicolochytrium jonesii TaxID=1396493 RepID=UPI0022FE393E|nr:uncharacterized protein EV422DRAFT_420040 [Fimicolochytrium jonesii]KAI8822178.1 hypothetical protein EV422DRAFT_420040 [Fimicolochytrium jonesii]
MPVRIFWPEHLLQPSKEQQEGYLVGWVSNGDTTCVADIVPAGRLKELQEFLTKNERNDLSPQIVGLCGPRRKPGAQLQWDSIRDHAAEFLIRVSLYGRDLIISDMYMRGVPLPHSTSKHVILFQEANSRLQQYYSLDPLILDLSAIDDELAVAKAELKRTAANFRRRQSSFGHGRSPGLIVEKPSVVPMDWNVVLHQTSAVREGRPQLSSGLLKTARPHPLPNIHRILQAPVAFAADHHLDP